MKRFIIYFFALVLSATFFVSCSRQEALKFSLDVDSRQIASPTPTDSITASPAPSKDLDVSFSLINPFFFRPYNDDRDIGVLSGYNYWVSSFIDKDVDVLGAQFFIDDIINHGSDEIEKIENVILSTDNLNEIKAKDYFSDTSTAYRNLTLNDIIMYCTDDYDPIVSTVEYINYDNNNRIIPKEDWIKSIERIVKKTALRKFKEDIDAPIVIRESWSFEHQGKNVEIVTANNLVGQLPLDSVPTKDLEKPTQMPKGNIFYVYTTTVMFIDNTEFIIQSWVSKITDSYFTPIEECDKNYTGLYSYQKSENDEVLLYPLFLTGTKDEVIDYYSYWTAFFFADVDNDEVGEVVCIFDRQSSAGLPSCVRIYDIVDGKLEDYGMGPCIYNFDP